MGESRPEPFRGRHFRDEIIVLCVRWYLRYPLSYRNLEEMMAERGLTIDHSTIARWVLRYAPVLNQRIRSEMRNPNRSWRVDETYIRVAGRGHIYIGPSTRPATPLISCSRHIAILLQRRAFSSLPSRKPGRFSPALSTSMGTRRTRSQSNN
jgi:hypothetical protein